ncbi:MAG: cupin domain-containing protein [Chloroflexi bacterium]|nr:cupin domain-containing protein [Chloroflexota bacterium]GIW11040.1 MAG: hypothetical protein KatS3mg061_2097 [Dehalococcoidia bacterium]
MSKQVPELVRWRERPRPEVIRGISSDHLAQVEGLIVALVELDPGAEVPPHHHEHHDEVFDVMEGEGEVWLGGGWRPLRRGEVVVVPAGRVHALRNPGPGPLRLRETIRQRVYLRAALRAAIRKRLPRWLRQRGQNGARAE